LPEAARLCFKQIGSHHRPNRPQRRMRVSFDTDANKSQ
jgi:hypothetical protein